MTSDNLALMPRLRGFDLPHHDTNAPSETMDA
jgi:hypothetical protein